MFKYKYQTEYEGCACVWDKHPSKFVKYLAEYYYFKMSGKRVLDLGAGEGKNSVYLASLGAEIDALDISQIALLRFEMQPGYQNCSKRITRLAIDARLFRYPLEAYDSVIAYGVLHCLDSKQEILAIVSKLKASIKKEGIFVGCTFNNELPPPKCQPYLNLASFLNKGEFKKLFAHWQILFYEDDIIVESHKSTRLKHQHSLSRIMAKKI